MKKQAVDPCFPPVEKFINIEDMAVLYGFCLFETFCTDMQGKAFLIDRHISRMLESAAFFNIDPGINADEIRAMNVKFIDENKAVNSIVRITLAAGNRNKGISPSIFFSKRENIYTPETFSNGFKLCVSDVKKSESSMILRHKTSNYLENYFLMQDAAKKGFDDILFLNSKAEITETGKCNIFFVKNKTLHTPEAACGLLPGIMRGWVIENSAFHGIQCIQGGFGLDDLMCADEVFATNSAMGIMPVAEIDGKPVGWGTEGEITKFLSMELFLSMEEKSDS